MISKHDNNKFIDMLLYRKLEFKRLKTSNSTKFKAYNYVH